MRATRAAAVAYDSSSVGEIVSDPAMLSKPLRGIVRRQQRGDVDPQVEQVADGVGVLRPVQPMQDHRARAGRVRRRARSISASSQSRSPSYSASGGRGTSGGGITPARSLRTTFSHTSAWSADLRQVQALQRQVRGLDAIVVTGDAVLVQQRAWLFDGSPRRGCRGGLRGLPAQRADRGGQAHPGRGDDSPHPIHGVSVA